MNKSVLSQSEISEALTALLGLASLPNDGANLLKVEKLAAAIDSANYLNTNMVGCDRYKDSLSILDAGMKARTITGGLILEFGVYAGRTVNHIASLDSARIFGFDSFEGLPEDWRPDILQGRFKRTGLPAVASNVELIVGWFDDTLPAFLDKHQGPVSFLHVDCDLYSSTKTIFKYLRPRIVPGTVIVFDEYFNYVGWRNHEFKAFIEFISETGFGYRYMGAVPSHQQVSVIIT